ncbi:MAG: SUF system NifU family Fe-S cluster assembly protein [Blastocatellia bacterium]|jgi:nitrogen fixation NifU-like protein|nr:SUF system NifU family Fe-S cluster assembly protein [Blastocatellia bacterium]MBK6426371.1 SUF system NifU family Fe-S cluster assembly protein [Blastocatellia bacterium]
MNSTLNELYQEVILDHNRKPRNFREIAEPTASSEGFNPLCGDQLHLYVKMNDIGIIEDVSFVGSGCAISKASASMLTTAVKGKTVAEARLMFDEFHRLVMGELNPDGENHLGRLKVFAGVSEFPARVKCASLAWHTLSGALDGVDRVSTE